MSRCNLTGIVTTLQEPRKTTRQPSQGFIDTFGKSRLSSATKAIFSRSSKSTVGLFHGQRNDMLLPNPLRVEPIGVVRGLVEKSVFVLERGGGKGNESKRETPALGRL